MAEQSFFDRVSTHASSHTPDVLSCIANLSNDEVFTPPDVVNKMLDLLPQELFANPKTSFLDPATKTGVFLREIAKRCLDAQLPNYKIRSAEISEKKALNIPLDEYDIAFQKQLQEKIDHIFHNQLYAIGITELTSLLARRSVYCSKYPNGPYSITHFDDAEGNIRFRRTEHVWQNGKCVYCGVSKKTTLGDENRRTELETHAYEFIHLSDPEDIFKMKFDVIIGNPPYQLNDGGNGASAMPIYQKFVEQAKKLNPRYLTMIIPARWYAGGKGLDDFRKNMLEDNHISHLVDYVNAKDCFPGTSIGGGICYFLRQKDYNGKCEYTNIHDKRKSTAFRKLNENTVFIRYNEAISIINKVKSFNEKSFSDNVGSRNPFGLSSSARGAKETNEIVLYSSGGKGYISRAEVTLGKDILDEYKVMISKVIAEHAGEPDKSGMFTVLSTTKLLKPLEVCTDSYLIAFTSNLEENAKNCISYMCTKFFRFLLLQAVSSINLSRDKFQFIPQQDYSVSWDDEKLYKKYNLSVNEIEFIESMVKDKTRGDE